MPMHCSSVVFPANMLRLAKGVSVASIIVQERRQQEGQMQLEAVLRGRDQEVSSLNHRSAHSAK